MNIQSYTRRICDIDGCDKKTRNKGFYKGKTRYDRVCEIHHRGKERAYYFKKRQIQNNKCENCGWDKAFCDRHRIIPSLGYTKENVKVLCPNCHRLVGLDLIKIA